MARTLSNEEKQRIRDDVVQFLAEEFEKPRSEIGMETKVVDDLGGDSILFLEMIEELKSKYGITLEVRTIGQYMMKKRISTVGDTLDAIYAIVEKGDDLIRELAAGGSGGT